MLADVLDRDPRTSRAVDVRRDAAASKTRFVQIVDSRDLALLFVHPTERFVEVLDLQRSMARGVEAPSLLEETMPAEDFNRLCRKLPLSPDSHPIAPPAEPISMDHAVPLEKRGRHPKSPEPQPPRKRRRRKSTCDGGLETAGSGPNFRSPKADASSRAMSPDRASELRCTRGLFYMTHKLRRIGQGGTVDAESVVVPHGRLIFLVTQTFTPIAPPRYTSEALLEQPGAFAAAAWEAPPAAYHPALHQSLASVPGPLVPFRLPYEPPYVQHGIPPYHNHQRFSPALPPLVWPAAHQPRPLELDELTASWAYDVDDIGRRFWHARQTHAAASAGLAYPPALPHPHFHHPYAYPHSQFRTAGMAGTVGQPPFMFALPPLSAHHPLHCPPMPLAMQPYDPRHYPYADDFFSDDDGSASSRGNSPGALSSCDGNEHPLIKPPHVVPDSAFAVLPRPPAMAPTRVKREPGALVSPARPVLPTRVSISGVPSTAPSLTMTQEAVQAAITAGMPHVPRLCESCLTTESPEWRKGPTGLKT
ncbi:hypothetical protein HDU86_006807 [Geranomyces michiganensis]|nr:hypothetical protein HDU86_006807 [Geranomyces michiganensis]